MGLKSLRSVGHNLAHSYLSMVNYDEGNYIVEHIYIIAKETKRTNIKIDVKNMIIEPEEYSIPVLRRSLLYLKENFARLLASEKLSINEINNAIIYIDFDLSKTQLSKSVPSLELPSYNTNVEIVDVNSKKHSASVVEWWRY